MTDQPMPALSAASLARARRLAEATGRTFYLGIRGHNGTLFAGLEARGPDAPLIEYDCGDFDEGALAVIDAARSQMRKRLREVEVQASNLHAALGET